MRIGIIVKKFDIVINTSSAYGLSFFFNAYPCRIKQFILSQAVNSMHIKCE